jgi:outer membrane lipoprotein-sorting protein
MESTINNAHALRQTKEDMGIPARRIFIAAICLLTILLPSCLVRRRLVTRQGKKDTRPLLNATRQELEDRIRTSYDRVHSFSATLDMTPALGSVYKGDITEYPGVRGFVLMRKPDDIRIIGLDPVIRTKAFDMVSTGNTFRLLLPSKNRFIEGKNDTPPNAANKWENLRPQSFLQAMLIYPPDPSMETAVLEDDTDEEHALYILLILRKSGDRLWLQRSIYFNRLTLEIIQQKTFDEKSLTVSDTRYSGWSKTENIPFPATIDINRPQDGYGVVMKLVNMKMNTEVTDDKFDLQRPEGMPLQVIGAPAR